MKVLSEHVYRVGEIEIDTSQGCIRRNGEERYLRQKAFQLLLYLLERRQRLVTKEELFEDIWEGTAVSDDALVQLVTEVRRSLGDDPRQPQFIKTIPKAGYRFIAPVEELIVGGRAIVETKEITTVEVEYEEECALDQPVVEMPRRILPASRSWQRMGIVLAALGIAVVALALYLRPAKPSLAEVTLPQLAGKRTVAVMHFENLSGSRDLDWLREGLADMLITDLSRSTRLTVLGRQQLHLLLERLGDDRNKEIKLNDALQIAQASQAQAVILGSFATIGEAVHISVQVYDARKNEPLASERIIAEKPKDIITQVDLLSLKLASHMGAANEGQETNRGLTEVMTSNLEAYRCYSLAVDKTYGLHNVEAITLLEKAVSLDPQFAMAYARIGYAYAVRWSFGEKGRPYLEKAFRLSDRLIEKDRLYIAGWYSIANFDQRGAIKCFQDLVARYPLEVEACWVLAGLLQGQERYEEALDAAKHGLTVDAESKELYNQLGGIYLDLFRPAEAQEMYQRYVALAPNEPNAHDSLALFYQAVGRYDEAIQSYERALALKPNFEVALIHLANVYVQQGRYRQAVTEYQRYIQLAPSEVEKARGYGALCDVYMRRGEMDRAEQAADKENKSRKSFSLRPLIFAMQRVDEAKANKLKEHLFASSSFSNRSATENRRDYNYYRGYIELKSGRGPEAIESFKEALKHRPPYWNLDTHEDCLASAYLELGMLDQAISEYERVISINPNYPLSHYYLALACEGKGDTARAHAEYSRFLQIWRNADSDIPEVIAATKQLATQS